MNTTAIAWTTAGIGVAASLFLLAGLCRIAGRTSKAEEAAGLTVWDAPAEKWVHLPEGTQPGPEQLTAREVEDADQLELLFLAPAYGETAKGEL